MASTNRPSITSLFPQKKAGRIAGASGDFKRTSSKGLHQSAVSNTKHVDGGFSSVKAVSTVEPASVTPAAGIDLDVDAGECDDLEETLCQFDMDMRYGPCLGMGRLQRWERADKMGLHPPIQVREILERVSGAPACLWETRI